MSLEVYYGDDCDALVSQHVCSDCSDFELAKVRGIALIHKSVSLTDPTNTAQWTAQIVAGKIIIISNVNGDYDGGSDKTGPGFGDQTESLITREHKLTFQDPMLKDNYAFYQLARNSKSYKLAYVTETLVHMVGKVVSIKPKAPVQNDQFQYVSWNVECKWNDKNDPQPFTKPEGIFDCFLTAEEESGS